MPSGAATVASTEVHFNQRSFNMAQLQQVSSEEEAVQFLQTNPHLGNVFKKMIKEGIQEEIWNLQKGMQGNNSDKIIHATPKSKDRQNNSNSKVTLRYYTLCASS